MATDKTTTIKANDDAAQPAKGADATSTGTSLEPGAPVETSPAAEAPATAATTGHAEGFDLAREGMRGVDRVFGTSVSTLTERARDLLRRILGELYQEDQGGSPASPLAHEVADAVRKGASVKDLNERGDRHQDTGGEGLNVRGRALNG